MIQALGEFILTHRDLKVKPRGKIYAINEGNERDMDEAVKEYIRSKKYPEPGPGGKRTPSYSARYVGSMVADIHRTLLYGGIFMYPPTQAAPDGKVSVEIFLQLNTLTTYFPILVMNIT